MIAERNKKKKKIEREREMREEMPWRHNEKSVITSGPRVVL